MTLRQVVKFTKSTGKYQELTQLSLFSNALSSYLQYNERTATLLTLQRHNCFRLICIQFSSEDFLGFSSRQVAKYGGFETIEFYRSSLQSHSPEVGT